MSNIPAELRYASSHEWILLQEDGTAVVGITEHAQDAMGDLVYVEMPDVGAELAAGDEAGVVESVKAASDIYAPVAGEVTAINEKLEEEPELVNNDPYNDGWLFKLKVADPSELENLLDADAYAAQLEAED
jgi:glycine cleavage system H protein